MPLSGSLYLNEQVTLKFDWYYIREKIKITWLFLSRDIIEKVMLHLSNTELRLPFSWHISYLCIRKSKRPEILEVGWLWTLQVFLHQSRVFFAKKKLPRNKLNLQKCPHYRPISFHFYEKKIYLHETFVINNLAS